MSGYDLPLKHADYPHELGYLYGCPACEAECHCDSIKITLGEVTECIFCASLPEYRDVEGA